MTLQEIRARKAQHVAAMRAVLNKATTEKRALSADEATQCDAMKADIESLEAQESRVAFLDEQERRAVGTVIAGNGGDTVAELEYRVSIMRVLQAGVDGRSPTGAELEYAIGRASCRERGGQ